MHPDSIGDGAPPRSKSGASAPKIFVNADAEFVAVQFTVQASDQ